ncbi:hypothetical protein M885DRAFT_465569 [Pelagophyceae sp. CCMP2097]|nr:hypothetical protein M885DRAFT_465569 [Pelagophyceae sp. CCMP2097]
MSIFADSLEMALYEASSAEVVDSPINLSTYECTSTECTYNSECEAKDVPITVERPWSSTPEPDKAVFTFVALRSGDAVWEVYKSAAFSARGEQALDARDFGRGALFGSAAKCLARRLQKEKGAAFLYARNGTTTVVLRIGESTSAAVVADMTCFATSAAAVAAAQRLAMDLLGDAVSAAAIEASTPQKEEAQTNRRLQAFGKVVRREVHKARARETAALAGAQGWCASCFEETSIQKLLDCQGRECGGAICHKCAGAVHTRCHSLGSQRVSEGAVVSRRCQRCQGRALDRREMLKAWRSSDREARSKALLKVSLLFAASEEASQKRAAHRFSEETPAAAAARSGRLRPSEFARLAGCYSTRKDADSDEDPVLLDAFDRADLDGDGYVDLHDVVQWLSSTARHAADRARETLAFGAFENDDPRAEFAAWPRKKGQANVGEVMAYLVLDKALLRLQHDSSTESTMRSLPLHPDAVLSSTRPSSNVVALVFRDPSNALSEETFTLAFANADAAKDWLSCIAETLAMARRLGTRLRPEAFKGQAFDEIERHAMPREALKQLGLWASGASPDGVAQRLGASIKSARRRSSRFSDEHEVEVHKGWAVDRVVLSDGRVKYEAAAPRRFRSAWRSVVKLIIRPPRARYEMADLGPFTFEVSSKRAIPRDARLRSGATDSFFVARSDFQIVNSQDLVLQCSLWCRVEGDPANRPCVLYCHGNASCRMEALPHVAPLLALGMRVCAFDAAGSGLSEGEFCTLGLRESADAASVADHLIASNKATAIGLFGRSMGAVAAILAGAQRHSFGGPNGGAAACVAADSPFSSLSTLVDVLARSAACDALAAPLPADVVAAKAPVDRRFVEAMGTTDPFSSPCASTGGARQAVAEAAAKAAVDAVRRDVEKRANFSVDAVDALVAVDTLDAPLFIVSAEDDALMPVRAHAGALLDRYAKRRPRRLHRDVEGPGGPEVSLALTQGGHNGRRSWGVLFEVYEFIAYHMLPGPGDAESKCRAVLARLEPFKYAIHRAADPWDYTVRHLESLEQKRAPTTPVAKARDDNFTSGMSAVREQQALRNLSNAFRGDVRAMNDEA